MPQHYQWGQALGVAVTSLPTSASRAFSTTVPWSVVLSPSVLATRRSHPDHLVQGCPSDVTYLPPTVCGNSPMLLDHVYEPCVLMTVEPSWWFQLQASVVFSISFRSGVQMLCVLTASSLELFSWIHFVLASYFSGNSFGIQWAE